MCVKCAREWSAAPRTFGASALRVSIRLKDRGRASQNGFLGPGYLHRDSRLPTYSDCMRRTVRCSPGPHESCSLARSPARFAAHKHANEDIPRVYTCGPTGRRRPTSRKCVAGFTTSRRKLKNVQVLSSTGLASPSCRRRGFVNPRRVFFLPSSSPAWSPAASYRLSIVVMSRNRDNPSSRAGSMSKDKASGNLACTPSWMEVLDTSRCYVSMVFNEPHGETRGCLGSASILLRSTISIDALHG